MSPYESCNDCCIVHSTSAGADAELVGGGGGWSCMFLLQPALTCADAGLHYYLGLRGISVFHSVILGMKVACTN